MTLRNRDHILYLNTRSLYLERQAEIKAAQDAELSIILATSSSKPYQDQNIDHIIEAPIGDYERSKKTILNYLQSNSLSVKGVVGWSDMEVELVAQIGKELGLPATLPDAARNVRNKANTRRLLTKHLPSANPKHAVVRDEDEFETALEMVGIPCLLKPAGSSGGRGVFRIMSREEALSKFRQYKEFCTPERDKIFSYFADEILVEELLVGSEHSVAGMVVDGQVILFAIMDKKVDFSVPTHYENVTPSKLTLETQNRIAETASRAVSLTGINWCGFHVDLIVTSEGPKVLEIGGRLGGECINSHLIPLSTPELRPYDALLKVIQGVNPFRKQNYIGDATHYAGWRAILPHKPGLITRLSGFEAVKEHPLVRASLQVRGLGDEVVLPEVRYNAYAVAYIVAQCGIYENMDHILAEIASLITIELNGTID